MKSYYLRNLFAIIIMPLVAFAQLSFEGLVKDENTETELEGALVVVKPLRNSGAGYYSGKVTESGKHVELMNKSGLYRSFYEKQIQK